MALELCSQDSHCDDDKICINGSCVCHPIYFNNNGSCLMCPEFQESCSFEKCCFRSSLGCIRDICRCLNGADTVTCTYNGPGFPMYVSASQIALSAALIMGMAALTMVVYRLCTKPRYLSARQRALASQMGFNIENENLSYATYLRASLTSMQIRVLTRLRDRPPTYDNRPAPIALPDAPPPYEGTSEGIALPPPYIEVVVSSTGYANSTFINTEPEGQQQTNRSAVCPNCDTSQQRRIEINNANCDKENKTDSSTNDKIESREENQINI
ncbi:uncharacterized protein LOC129943333 [Eupeodes corollae]|uniref:uncharacterized protein LOC129943333 n=1 Tax=Eupeodes corollae TaxID=290404 RepID=UPI00249012E4|nr:uncharacterized protein LOC129943333 [Eupeodes corollae]